MGKEWKRLNIQIQHLKNELKLTVSATGLDSQETLKCSQKLDKLIINYQMHERPYVSK
ncbi:Spo0E family sporulation regulatory protein-aspartic acid phosphatase [Niallia sp. Krafla_26]|uniref:Spo0E family sporulation regulatory protein-aspartic acid phosphatase n=1 Tax=Niallia sp. Krafla_26 TaxID=3064703 RepID=UPI003D1707E8